MSENKIKKIEKIPEYAELFGAFEDEFSFTPDALFDQFGIPKDKRYNFKLKPLSEKDRTYLQGLLAAHHTESLRRAIKEGINIQLIGKDLSTLKLSKRERTRAVEESALFYKIVSDTEPRADKFELARRYVIGFENGFALERSGELIPLSFASEGGEECISGRVWSKIMPKVKELIVQELQNISGLTAIEIQSL